ncbi:MAG: ankyrin repeat domain-containing protein [Rickettsiales bacterium]
MIPEWFSAEENSLQALILKGVDEVKKYLEEYPESINNKDSQGSTALHYATMFGKLDIDEKYLEDLIKYYQEYDEPEKFHSSSENLIKDRFAQLKQEFIDSTKSELDYVLHNKNDNSAIMAQEFSKIFGLKNLQDFEQLQQKF